MIDGVNQRRAAVLLGAAGLLLWALTCSAADSSKSTASRRTICVSQSGSDSADGTAETPLRTIARAAALARPGDTVLIGNGTYREALVPVRSGEPGAPIVFTAAPGARPIITGCDRISNWGKTADGRWKAKVDWDLGTGINQIFFNGTMLTEARHPNKTSTGLLEHDLETLRFPTNGVARGAAFHSDEPDKWAGAYFFGHGYEAWAFQCARVAASKDDRLVFDPQTLSDPWFEKPMGWGDPSRLAIGEGGGFVFGIPVCLDVPGEWFWNGERVELIPPAGQAIGSARIEARRRDWTLRLDDRNHIVVRGLRFVAGAIRIRGNHNILEDCEGLYLSHFMTHMDGYALHGRRANGIGLNVEGEGNIIRRCRIAKTSACGVALRGRNNLLTRCLIEDINYTGTYGAGISVGGEKQRVMFNTVRRAGRDCLQINSGTSPSSGGHRVLLNDISTPGLICMDTGIIYFFGTDGKAADGTGTRIAYNWVYDNPHHIPSPGIYLDNYVRNFTVDHNVIWDVPSDAGIRINAPSEHNLICHNTLFRAGKIGSHTFNVYPNYNPDPSIWVSKEQYAITVINNLELFENPEGQLNDPAGLDFTLKAASPAIGAAKTREALSTIPCKSPDLGAYQTGMPVWVPGHKGHAGPMLLSGENLENVTL
jgi:hypothetical protein